MLKKALTLLALASLSAGAQSTNPAAAKMLWAGYHDYIAAAAKDVPENLYSFKPTPEVRSFGEILGHVAGAEKMFCGMVLGDKMAEDDVEKNVKTKAGLIAALADSKTYCDKAYARTDAQNAAMIDLFGQQRSMLYALMTNGGHDGEHYGNLVTYMRLKGLVPPSSAPR